MRIPFFWQALMRFLHVPFFIRGDGRHRASKKAEGALEGRVVLGALLGLVVVGECDGLLVVGEKVGLLVVGTREGAAEGRTVISLVTLTGIVEDRNASIGATKT
jgi:hypothetical protein